MSKKLQSDSLIITKAAYTKALRYAMSLNEVGFLFFGKGNRITEVVRIKNSHEEKENRFSWDTNAYYKAVEKFKNKRLIAEGHSHSKSTHLKNPSKADLNYFKKGFHIIVFPNERLLRGWRFHGSVLRYAPEAMKIILA